MPKKYEAIRDKFEEEGMSTKQAEEHAAKIYNSSRKPGQKPVARNSDKKKGLVVPIESFENGRVSILKP